jgi:hypothetical protein
VMRQRITRGNNNRVRALGARLCCPRPQRLGSVVGRSIQSHRDPPTSEKPLDSEPLRTGSVRGCACFCTVRRRSRGAPPPSGSRSAIVAASIELEPTGTATEGSAPIAPICRCVSVFRSYAPGISGAARPGSSRSIFIPTFNLSSDIRVNTSLLNVVLHD